MKAQKYTTCNKLLAGMYCKAVNVLLGCCQYLSNITGASSHGTGVYLHRLTNVFNPRLSQDKQTEHEGMALGAINVRCCNSQAELRQVLIQWSNRLR